MIISQNGTIRVLNKFSFYYFYQYINTARARRKIDVTQKIFDIQSDTLICQILVTKLILMLFFPFFYSFN